MHIIEAATQEPQPVDLADKYSGRIMAMGLVLVFGAVVAMFAAIFLDSSSTTTAMVAIIPGFIGLAILFAGMIASVPGERVRAVFSLAGILVLIGLLMLVFDFIKWELIGLLLG